MERKRHLHMYVAVRVALRPGVESRFPAFEPFKTKTVEENQRRQQEHKAKCIQNALESHDMVDVSEVDVFALDFYSSEYNTDFAVPDKDSTRKLRLASKVKDTGTSAAVGTFAELTRWLKEDDHALYPGNISFRCKDGIFARRAIRIDIMRNGGGSKVMPQLFFETSTFSWHSVLCPKTHGDIDELMSQLQLSPYDPADTGSELTRTLELFQLVGLNPLGV